MCLNNTSMDNIFDEYAISIDSDVLSQDFDDIDLYGDKIEEDNTDSFSDNIEYE